MKPRGPRPLAEIVVALVAPACRKRGVANAALLLDPADIFGERFAKSAAVEKIVWPERGDGGATLVVRADAAAALALQHVAPQVIERVNILIGWPAVARLRLTQARGRIRHEPRALSRRAVPPPPPDPARTAALAADLADVEHAELKRALARLGVRVQERGSTTGARRP